MTCRYQMSVLQENALSEDQQCLLAGFLQRSKAEQVPRKTRDLVEHPLPPLRQDYLCWRLYLLLRMDLCAGMQAYIGGQDQTASVAQPSRQPFIAAVIAGTGLSGH